MDYYRAQLVVPDNAYELNFVFSNGDGLFDNNANQVGSQAGWAGAGACCSPLLRRQRVHAGERAGRHARPSWLLPRARHAPIPTKPVQNYVLPVAGPMTRELWIDTAPERAVSLRAGRGHICRAAQPSTACMCLALSLKLCWPHSAAPQTCCAPRTRPPPQEAAWRAKKAEEARLAQEAAAAAVAAAEAEDKRKAGEAVAELKSQYGAWREGAAKEVAGRWKMVPAVSSPGGGAWVGRV